MPRRTLDFETVRKIGLALPDVEESTAYGSTALKVHGKLLACVPSHRSAEPGSLVVRVDFDDRAELLAADPDVYYVTDHYLNYTSVLVRLSRVTPDVLRDLLGMAHKFVTAMMMSLYVTLGIFLIIRRPSTTNRAMTTTCATTNGASDCVGAIAFRAGTFWKTCATKTKTFRYSPITTFTA